MAITRVGIETASATTVTVPAHEVGDLILIWALRGGSTTAPTLPAGYSPIQTESESTATSCSARLGYKIATSTSDASGTWTNASELLCHVYRASSGYALRIGQSAVSKSTTAEVTYPALTLADSFSGNSWIVGFVGAGNKTQAISSAPSGMMNESSVTGATYSAAGQDTNEGVSSWPSTNADVTGTGSTVSATVEIVLAPQDNPFSSNIYQHVGGGGNPYVEGLSGNTFKLPLPNASAAGNCLVLAITNDGGATIDSISDNINGTWPAAAVTALAGSGSLDSRIYVLPNITAGLATITVTYAAAVDCFQYCVTELYGIATSSPTNGTESNTNSTTTAVGSFTPGNNNADGGNFVWAYFAKSVQSAGTISTGIFPSQNFTLLNADIGWNKVGYSMTKAVTAYVQATSAAIDPAIISVAETGDPWNSLAVALKLLSGAGGAPPSGMRVNGIQHFSTTNFPTAGNYDLQVSTTGNLRCICCCDPNLNFGSMVVSDSEGNLWTADGQSAGFWYCANVVANPNLSVFIDGGGADSVLSWRFMDISGAATSPFDSALTSDQGVDSDTTFTASPAPSPTSSAGLTISNIGLGQGPGLAVTAPSGAIWDLCTYTDEIDGDLIENADIMAHYAYSAAGAQTWTFSITDVAANSTTGGFIAFTASAGGSGATGSAAITFAADGTLTATGALAGTTATTVGANATLTASGALAGSVAITFAASATATLPGLEGTTAITIGAIGTLTAVGTLSAAAAITFAASADLIGEGALTGASAITFAADGTLTATGVLLGTTSTTFTAAGALTAMGALAGAASATFGASATAEGAGALQGTTDLSFAATGTLTQPGLSGSTGLSIGVSASLEGAGALGGEAGITFSASGTLIQPGLSGTTGLTFSAAGTVAGRGALLGSASVSLGAAGTVNGIGTLAGTTAASMSASATLTGAAAATGTCSLTMTASGLLSGAGTLAGMSAMVFSGQGTLEGLAALSGLTSIQFEASASPGTAGAISGTTGMSFALVGQLVALLQGDPGYFLAAPPFMSMVTAQTPITTITAPPFTSSVTAD